MVGDGRCASPGHNAKYGTYTMMTEEGKVATFSLVQVTEVSSSNAMEKEGFERCFKEITDGGVVVKRVTTDRHPSIACAMDKEHKTTTHQFDVWHVAKSIVKKLTKKSQTKGNGELKPWIKSIINHFWWCSRSCNGDADLLREMWMSVLHHVTNVHEWMDCKVFKKCAHPLLTPDQVHKKKWLSPTSTAYIALEEVVLEKKLLKDLSKVTEFCHTGDLEVYHSMLLKYCPKRQHFSHKGMVARTQLTAIDNNANCGRKQATVGVGDKQSKPRYKAAYNKAQKQWVAKPIYEKKSYAHVTELMNSVVELCQSSGVSAMDEIVILPKNIAPMPAPDKEQLIADHRSRLL